MTTTTLAPNAKTGGLLLKAFQNGETEEIRWVEVTLGDLIITVASDALKAPLNDRGFVRLPVTYKETIEICRDLECIAPTQAMCDAMFAQAKSQTLAVPLVIRASDSAKMPTVEFVLKFHDGVEKQLAGVGQEDRGLICGAWKYWLLHPRLNVLGAVNYGFWKSKKPPSVYQTPGARHDPAHYDYSQLLQPVQRKARRVSTGEEVDLLEYVAQKEKIPAKYLDVYQPTLRTFSSVEDNAEPLKPVDVLALLEMEGLDVVAEKGWDTRGRSGFTPEGIMVHHTAGPKTGDAPCLSICVNGRPDLSGPLCHILLSRSGKVHLIAANIANHAGKGARQVLDLVRKDEPVTKNARDNRYVDSIGGNQFFYGIEVENAGVAGDPYPPAQLEALARICAIICNAHSWSANRVIHHRQWTSRKIDMSWRGDLPGMVAQYMDSLVISFSTGEDPTEPMWEDDHDGVAMHDCGDADEGPASMSV
ncbi:MAG: N-acetylmuramoyl-L-alanine amidase [Polyangiaceae bacterium]|nr:N-acetylmuramoyl-L-alanine amidase [Polyangiaceae bacterium]